MPNPKRHRENCRSCGKETTRAGYRYCSNVCQFQFQHDTYIRKWKVGEVNGLQSMGIVSSYVKKYLRKKFGDKCVQCEWAKVNKVTGKVPLVADHIDGNWRNNIESNLRLLCPNCDALTSTYAALNKGRGRENRTISKRVKEARLLLRNKPS